MTKITKKQLNDFFDEVWQTDKKSEKLCPKDDLDLPEQRYDIIELVGKGAMKKVYKAYDNYTCRCIALAKLVEPEDENLLNAFLHEARLTSQLDHPNIMKIHDIGIGADNEPFFTMDLKSGMSLAQYCMQPQYQTNNYSLILQIFSQICTAVSYAHRKGIIHLDLKPENIQIGQFNEVVICDWGLGTTTEKIDLQEAINNPFYKSLLNTKPDPEKVYGTPGFMSPEQFDPLQVNDTRSDIYGLACLLYFMLIQRSPFEGTLGEIKRRVHNSIYKLPSSYNKNIPHAIEAMIIKGLQKEKDNRYRNVELLYQDIQKHLRGFTISAEKSSFGRELSHFIKRNKPVCISLFVSFLIISTLLTIFITSLEKSHTKTKKAHRTTLTTLHLLQKEQVQNEELRAKIIQQLYNDILKLKDKIFLSDPNDAIRSGLHKCLILLSKDPESEAYNAAAFELYLIKSDLVNAQKCLEKLKNTNYEIFQKFIEENIGSFDGIGTGHNRKTNSLHIFKDYLNSFLMHCPNELNLMQKMIAYDLKKRKLEDGYNEDHIIKLALTAMNPQWNIDNWSFDNRTLKIHGSNFHRSRHRFNFHAKTNFLSLIFLDSLDVSGTSLKNGALEQLSRVKELNISNTNINSTKRLPSLNRIRKLIIHKGQIPEHEFKFFSKNVKIIVVDKDSGSNKP